MQLLLSRRMSLVLAWRSRVALLQLVGLSLHPEAECVLPLLDPAASLSVLPRMSLLDVLLQLGLSSVR